MKHLLITSSLLVATAGTALADKQAMATIIGIEPNYRTVWMDVPRTECRNVEVPIYGTIKKQGNAAEGALAGMIIGGILGKGVSGNDDGAAAGAVIGGLIGADKGAKGSTEQVITGYRKERQCSEVMVREKQTEIKNYTIRYEWNGVTGKSYTYNRYRLGDRIPVSVSINAQ
jgi:uncharacterized protein YcfJ